MFLAIEFALGFAGNISERATGRCSQVREEAASEFWSFDQRVGTFVEHSAG